MTVPSRSDYNFRDLQLDDQQLLLDICSQDIMSFAELPVADREIVWDKRHYLRSIPGSNWSRDSRIT